MKFVACMLAIAASIPMSLAAANPEYSETTQEAPGPTGPLKGSLLAPRSTPRAVVLILPGSGLTDRDGNSPAGMKAATYRLLAHGLASQGVATLRIDKRGLFASAQAVKDANAVTIADYVEDVRAWVNVLRAETHAPCVWILGHSEGGLVALASAGRVQEACGLVLVATPAKPLGELLRDQLKANPANEPLLGQALPAIDALEHGHPVDTKDMPSALQTLFNPAVQGFLIDAFGYDPSRLIAGVDKPVLIIQGRRDLQVGEANGLALKAANPRARLVVLPDANHVMKSVAPNDPRANFASYADPSLPLAPGVIEAIASFLSDNKVGPAK